MSINIIVAVGRDGAIGRGGDLIWRLPADLPRFKQLTMGYPVIMGRRTWESLPKGALPGRRNIVVSRTPGYDAPGAEVVPGLAEALAACAGAAEVFIIGGGRLYEAAMPLADSLMLTCVDAGCADADTFFPAIDASQWSETMRSEDMVNKEGVVYRFINLRRKE